jgi:MoxR-like ATPase
MPTDIVGTEILEEIMQQESAFLSSTKDLVANIILADEINRTPPKTQSAYLKPCRSSQLLCRANLSARQTFFILATQNPIEQAGTYPCRGTIRQVFVIH